MRTGVLWGVLLTLAAWSQAQTAVQARLLLDDEAMAHCAVYVVDIERRGSDTRGELVVELPNGWRGLPDGFSRQRPQAALLACAERADFAVCVRAAAVARRGRRAR